MTDHVWLVPAPRGGGEEGIGSSDADRHTLSFLEMARAVPLGLSFHLPILSFHPILSLFSGFPFP